MKYCAGLDVSVKETAICIVDKTGKIAREAKVTTEPEAIVALLKAAGFEYAQVGLEAGPMSQSAGLPVVCRDPPYEGGAQSPAGEQERSQRFARDRADDASRIVQANAREDTGEPARTDAADVAKAITREAAGHRERAPGGPCAILGSG